ncbi:MAG: YaaA family protein [Candidatus Krumholzibacteriota bacterium]
MLILLNSTKTMDLTVPVPGRLKTTEPAFLAVARDLAGPLAKISLARLDTLMDVKGKLADRTRADLALWGKEGRESRPALLAFTGLVYKYLDAPSLKAAEWNRARKCLRILSGLYGLLGPLDEVEAYRLEMGSKVKPKGAKNLTVFWRDRLTAALNAELKAAEPVVSVASQEYVKALDIKNLKGPLISPVFKEERPDGSLRTAPVHAKMARGALVRYALKTGARTPEDFLGFGEMGWEAASEPPASGPWLFVRAHRG